MLTSDYCFRRARPKTKEQSSVKQSWPSRLDRDLCRSDWDLFLVKRLREKDKLTHATEQKRYGNTKQEANTSSDDARKLDNLVKQMCVAILNGERRNFEVPIGYRDYSQGRLLEAFAQGRHPDDIKQGQPTRDSSELRAAVERLQSLAQSPYPTPELVEYFSKIEDLRGQTSESVNGSPTN